MACIWRDKRCDLYRIHQTLYPLLVLPLWDHPQDFSQMIPSPTRTV